MHIPFTIISLIILFVSNSLITVINVMSGDYLIVALGAFLQVCALFLILVEFANLLRKK